MGAERGWLPGILYVALLMLGFGLKGLLLVPAEPPAAVANGQFDTGRALARLQRILGDQRPHPVDSAANDAVRNRLIAELRAIGLEPRIQEASDCSAMPKSRAVSCSRVRNVIATVGGGPGKHLLLNSHYDSTPTGPGAADDGIGVAAMLEIASILQASRPQRPVTFLFNEGEEYGLNGASAFVREDPLRGRVDSLINIEARGVSGPAVMFETSDPNGAAIALYADGARRPFANSLSMDFAKLIPNTTDVVEFRPAGWTILNYAIIGNETRYHSPGDTIAALDRASVHHVGSEVLAATRTLAGSSPAHAASSIYVFTDVAGRLFLRLRLPIAAVGLALMTILALTVAYRRKALGRAFVVAAVMTISGIAAAFLASVAAGFLRAGDYWRAYPLLAYLAIYASLLAAMLFTWRRLKPGSDHWRMRAAVWLLILFVGCVLSALLPGAAIYHVAAPAIALVGLLLVERSTRAAGALIWIAAAIQFLMFAQLLALIEMLLIDGPLWAVAPLAALAALPILVEIDAARSRPAVLTLAIAALGLWAAALLMPRASAERPAAFTIDYFRDDAAKKAHWAVASKQAPLPDAFPGTWRKGVLAYNSRTRWVSDAPLIETPAPSARVLKSEPAGNGRRVWLQLSPGGANAVAIRFAKGTAIQRLGLPAATQPIPARGEPEKASLRCSGRSCDGLVIEVLLGNRRPVKAELFATRFALPVEGALLALKRPANAHPQYGPDSSIRMRAFAF